MSNADETPDTSEIDDGRSPRERFYEAESVEEWASIVTEAVPNWRARLTGHKPHTIGLYLTSARDPRLLAEVDLITGDLEIPERYLHAGDKPPAPVQEAIGFLDRHSLHLENISHFNSDLDDEVEPDVERAQSAESVEVEYVDAERYPPHLRFTFHLRSGETPTVRLTIFDFEMLSVEADSTDDNVRVKILELSDFVPDTDGVPDTDEIPF